MKSDNLIQIIQAKTLLVLLPEIDRYCDHIAGENQKSAVNSFYAAARDNFVLHDTYRLMERIIDKTYKAHVLYNLKLKILKQLKYAPHDCCRVTELFFAEHKTVTEISQLLNISERSVYRCMDQAIKWLAEHLSDCGVNWLTFKQLLKNYDLIRDIYENIK